MRELTFITATAVATQACGTALAPLLSAGDVLLLSGDLGAGKTQLTKGIARGLEVADPVTSPTFNILLVHEGSIPLYHFDLYRLERVEELHDIDYYAVLEGDGVSVVEWGDRFPTATPADGLIVTLQIGPDGGRRIGVKPIGRRGAALVQEWVLACAGAQGVAVEDAS